MSPRSLIAAAAAMSILTAAMHVFGGGPQFHEPALASGMSAVWQALFSTIWHQVTAFLLLNSVFLLWPAATGRISPTVLALIAAQNTAFALMFLGYGWMRLGSVLVLPQWIIFLGISLPLIAALLMHRKDVKVIAHPA
jgi:hypothetical protein